MDWITSSSFAGNDKENCESQCDSTSGCTAFTTWDDNGCALYAGECILEESHTAPSIESQTYICSGKFLDLDSHTSSTRLEPTNQDGFGNCADDYNRGYYDSEVSWTHLRWLDKDEMKIDINDHTFATQVNGCCLVPLGFAKDCHSDYSTRGQSVIDLRGTNYKVSNAESCTFQCSSGSCYSESAADRSCGQWVLSGYRGRMEISCSEGGQLCEINCGGRSGDCSLESGYLQLAIFESTFTWQDSTLSEGVSLSTTCSQLEAENCCQPDGSTPNAYMMSVCIADDQQYNGNFNGGAVGAFESCLDLCQNSYEDKYTKYRGMQCGELQTLMSLVSTDPNECARRCDLEESCVGFVIVHDGTYGGNCYLRDSIEDDPPRDYSSVDDRDCYVKSNNIYTWNEILEDSGTTCSPPRLDLPCDPDAGTGCDEDECAQHCFHTSNCVYFFNNPNGRCVLYTFCDSTRSATDAGTTFEITRGTYETCEKCPEGACDRSSRDPGCKTYSTLSQGYHCFLGIGENTQCSYDSCFDYEGKKYFSWKSGSANVITDPCYDVFYPVVDCGRFPLVGESGYCTTTGTLSWCAKFVKDNEEALAYRWNQPLGICLIYLRPQVVSCPDGLENPENLGMESTILPMCGTSTDDIFHSGYHAQRNSPPPTAVPTLEPTVNPTSTPTQDPSVDPSSTPTQDPTVDPTQSGASSGGLPTQRTVSMDIDLRCPSIDSEEFLEHCTNATKNGVSCDSLIGNSLTFSGSVLDIYDTVLNITNHGIDIGIDECDTVFKQIEFCNGTFPDLCTKHLVVRQTMPFLFDERQWSRNVLDPSNDNFAALTILDRLRYEDGRMHFSLEWPGDETYMEWLQTSLPMTEDRANYSPVHIPYTTFWNGGLGPTPQAVLSGSSKTNRWFYAVATYRNFNGQIPAYYESQIYLKDSVELYTYTPNFRLKSIGPYHCDPWSSLPLENEKEGVNHFMNVFQCLQSCAESVDCNFAMFDSEWKDCFEFRTCDLVSLYDDTTTEISVYERVSLNTTEMLLQATYPPTASVPSQSPSTTPTVMPTDSPTDEQPTGLPSTKPTVAPSVISPIATSACMFNVRALSAEEDSTSEHCYVTGCLMPGGLESFLANPATRNSDHSVYGIYDYGSKSERQCKSMCICDGCSASCVSKCERGCAEYYHLAASDFSAKYSNNLNEILVTPGGECGNVVGNFGSSSSCTSEASQIRILLSADAEIEPNSVITYSGIELTVERPDFPVQPEVNITTSLSCNSLIAYRSSFQTMFLFTILRFATVVNAGVQASFLWSNGATTGAAQLALSGETSVSVSLTVTNILGAEAIAETVVDISQTTIQLYGLFESTINDDYKIESAIMTPNCDVSDGTYNWVYNGQDLFTDVIKSNPVLQISSSQREIGTHTWTLEYTMNGIVTISEPFTYETSYAPISLQLVGSVSRKVVGLTEITTLIIDPQQSCGSLQSSWSSDCETLPIAECSKSGLSTCSSTCHFEVPEFQGNCTVYILISDDFRSANTSLQLEYSQTSLDVAFVSNMQSDPFKFLAYSAEEGVTWVWMMDGLEVTRNSILSIARSILYPGKEYAIQLIGRKGIRSEIASTTIIIPVPEATILEVFPTNGVEFDTAFLAVVSGSCDTCLYQFYLLDTVTNEVTTISELSANPVLEEVYLPSGSYKLQVAESGQFTSSQEITVQSQAGSIDCSAIPTTLSNCAFLGHLIALSCDIKIHECFYLLSLSVGTCGSNSNFLLSVSQGMLVSDLQSSQLDILWNTLKFIVDCWVTNTSPESLASKFTDGSTISSTLVSNAFSFYDDLLDQTTNCTAYANAEKLLTKLALAGLLYNLPGESNVRNQLFSRRHSQGQLSQQVSHFDVALSEAAAATGRSAFRDLHSAYDSLDFIAFSVPSQFVHCFEEASNSLSMTLSMDEIDGTLVTYQLPSRAGATCRFWDESIQAWRSEGLSHTVRDGFDVCSSDHLTLFTIMYEDVDETDQVLWSIIAGLHVLTLAAVSYQMRRLLRLNMFTFFETHAGAVATVSHALIGVIAALDLSISILLLSGTTHAAVFILRIIPFCLTVLLYSLVARQWIRIARGALDAGPSDGNIIISTLNIGILVLCLIITMFGIFEKDLSFIGTMGVALISILCGALWLLFGVTGFNIIRRIRKMSTQSGVSVPMKAIRRTTLAATAISFLFACLSALNTAAAAEADWFKAEYALIQGLFLGCRVLVLWVVLYLHNSLIDRLETPEKASLVGVNPLECLIPRCSQARLRLASNFSFNSNFSDDSIHKKSKILKRGEPSMSGNDFDFIELQEEKRRLSQKQSAPADSGDSEEDLYGSKSKRTMQKITDQPGEPESLSGGGEFIDEPGSEFSEGIRKLPTLHE